MKTILGRNPGNRKKFAVIDEGVEGREAITSYKKIYDLQFIIYNFEKLIQEFNKNQKRYYESNAKNYSFLEVYPATGRTHQIRVHLKYLGYPIVSDQTYCPAKLLRLDLKWCKRQFLHAELLGFYHPESEKWTLFTSELPEDLEKALEILEKK